MGPLASIQELFGFLGIKRKIGSEGLDQGIDVMRTSPNLKVSRVVSSLFCLMRRSDLDRFIDFTKSLGAKAIVEQTNSDISGLVKVDSDQPIQLSLIFAGVICLLSRLFNRNRSVWNL